MAKKSIKERWKKFKSYFTLDTVPYMLMMLAALLIIGMIDVVNATFSPYRIVTPDYWVEVGLLTIANMLVLTSSTNLTIKELLKTDPDVLLLKALIRKAVLKLKPDFAEFMHRFNLKRKEKKHRYDTTKKISKLNGRTPFMARAHFLEAQRQSKDIRDVKLIYPPKLKEGGWFWVIIKKFFWKLLNRREVNYFQKMKHYLYLLTKEWVDSNLEYADISYSEIKPSYIKVGSNNESIYEFEPIPDAKKKFKDLAPRFFLNLGLAVFIASFFLVPQEPTTAMILSISVKIIILGMNWQRGRNYAPVFIVEQTMANDQFRYDTLLDYFTEKGVKLDGENTITSGPSTRNPGELSRA